MLTVMAKTKGEPMHGSLTDVLRGVVGFSFLAALLAGAGAGYFGITLPEFQTVATMVGGVVGGVIGYRHQ